MTHQPYHMGDIMSASSYGKCTGCTFAMGAILRVFMKRGYIWYGRYNPCILDMEDIMGIIMICEILWVYLWYGNVLGVFMLWELFWVYLWNDGIYGMGDIIHVFLIWKISWVYLCQGKYFGCIYDMGVFMVWEIQMVVFMIWEILCVY